MPLFGLVQPFPCLAICFPSRRQGLPCSPVKYVLFCPFFAVRQLEPACPRRLKYEFSLSYACGLMRYGLAGTIRSGSNGLPRRFSDVKVSTWVVTVGALITLSAPTVIPG